MSLDIRGVLLCGGASARFGGDKLLAPFSSEGAPIVSHSARHLVSAVGSALAIIPTGAAQLRRALEAAGCAVLETDDTRRGLGASLAAGIAAAAGADGWIVALGDMPLIRPRTIEAVRASLEAGALIAAPTLVPGGRRGHPVGFSKALRGELAALDGDEGARAVIARHRGSIVLVEVDDPGIVADIDTPADLERLR